MITNLLFNYINKIQTGYMIVDILYVVLFSTFVFIVSQSEFKNKILQKFEQLFTRKDKTNKIIFYSHNEQNTSRDMNISKRYKAIMYYISTKNDPSINKLIEHLQFKYNRKNDAYEEPAYANYRVDQDTKFMIDTNIMGLIYYQSKESGNVEGTIKYTEFCNLEIISSKLTLPQLQQWVENKVKEYETYIKKKSCDKQLLVEISWNPKMNESDIYYHYWKSNASFENRFFTNKKEIIDKINFFINNPEWYSKRGIPYTLGFLIWGEPGCGKTGFIKSLMNLTGRHAVSIKLNNSFDMNYLREVIFDDEICNDIIIPQDNRILIFEDIDCMSDVVKDRSIKKNTSNISDLDSDSENLPITKKALDKLIEQKENKYNNNLSYFLNILDGLQECNGRIIIMTTNKPETLDKALIRPGRIDYNIHFTKATLEDIQNIIKLYWNTEINLELNEDINLKYSHAEIINFCRLSNSQEMVLNKLI